MQWHFHKPVHSSAMVEGELPQLLKKKKKKINPITILWCSILNQYMYNVQILSYTGIYNLFLLIRNRTNVH